MRWLTVGCVIALGMTTGLYALDGSGQPSSKTLPGPANVTAVIDYPTGFMPMPGVHVQLHRNTGIERDFGVWRFGKV